MTNRISFQHRFLTGLMIAILSGCGGGGGNNGGGGSGPSTPPDGENSQAIRSQAKAYRLSVLQFQASADHLSETYQQLLGPQSPREIASLQTAHNNWLDALDQYANALTEAANASSSFQNIQPGTLSAQPTHKSSAHSTNYRNARGVGDDILSLVPGTDHGIGLSTAKQIRDSLEKARKTREKLDGDFNNGHIDEQEYRSALLREARKQAGEQIIVGGSAVGGALVSTFGALAAGATGVSLLPVIAVGTLTGYVGGKVFTYFFTSNTDDTGSVDTDCSHACTVVVGESRDGTVKIPSNKKGTLTIVQEDTHPVSIQLSLPPEADTHIHLNPLPDDQPLPEAIISTEQKLIVPEADCAKVEVLQGQLASSQPGQLTLSVNTVPPVGGCRIQAIGRIEHRYGEIPIDSILFSGTPLTLATPEFGDYTIVIGLETSVSQAKQSIVKTIQQPNPAILSMEPVNPAFMLKTGEQLDVGYLTVRLRFADGSTRIASASSDAGITWKKLDGAGALNRLMFIADSPGVTNLQVSFDDGAGVTGSTRYAITVEPKDDTAHGVIVGATSMLFTAGGNASHCVSTTQYPPSWSMGDIQTFRDNCKDLEGCSIVPECPSNWVNACEGRLGLGPNGGINNWYFYFQDPFQQSACAAEQGIWK
ncbi:hypothetical protein HDN1F_07760 [gamma proteobacterium HdN1]|nr:hypothetical protein HDN1F_07760 [gamma proteobacterium HdN1]